MKASKILAILLAAVLFMAAGLSITASAAGENATLTLTPPEGLVLAPGKFTAFKLFDVVITGTSPKNYTYTPTAALHVFLNDNANRAAFCGDPAGELTQAEAAAAFKAYLEGTPDMDAVNRALTASPPYAENCTKDAEEAGTGVKFTGLDHGWYLIIGTADVVGSPGKEVVTYSRLHTVEKNETISIKADKPTLNKTVEGDKKWTDVNVGDTVTFTLTSKVPDMTGYSQYTFTVHDLMSPGLTFDKDSVEVMIGGSEYNDFVVLTGAALAASKAANSETCDCNIHIVFDPDEFVKLQPPGQAIIITYEAELNQNAVIGAPGNLNTANLQYSSSPYSTTKTNKTPDTTAKVFTFDLKIFKFTGSDLAPLDDAEFQLMKTDDANADPLEFVLVDPGDDDTPAIYRLPDADDLEKGVVLVDTLITPKSGQIEIQGLDAGTYYLFETKAPDGYTQIIGSIKVEIIHADGEGTVQMKIDNASDTSGYVNVENKTGGTLPGTGGIGTTIFYIVSAVLTAGLVAFFVIRRRRNILTVN